MYKTLITQDRLDALVRCAKLVPEGIWAEGGVYQGGSLKWLSDNFPDKHIIGFDTFEGLPKEHWKSTEVHAAGDFNDTEYAVVKEYLSGNPNVLLLPGMFPETAKNLSDRKFAFVHVDFDFEEGIKAALDFFWPRMVPGGMMVFDDFGWSDCPGVAKALRGYPVIPTANYQVAIRK